MEARAIARNVRIAPRKVRLVLDLIRGKDVDQALAYLDATHRKAVPVIKALLKSAIANAGELNPDIDVDNLVIKEAYADKGATLKRFRARAMGRGARVNKYSSHITLIVGDAV
ncbi:MAG: 50S ribosomal protein L22 [SAR324 cluster bacterium]|nr:50S ribosomal protein L22 [SAR324 cluster bacterium]